MRTVRPDQAPAAAMLLPPGALVEALREAGVAAAVLGRAAAGPLRDVVVGRVAEVLQDQLADIDLADLVHTAWDRAGDLRGAIARTRADPAGQEDVVLVDHEVTSEHHPSIEVALDGRSVATSTFDVTLVLELYGLVAIVRGGGVSAMRSGEVSARANLAWQGRDLLAPPPVRLLAGFVVPLGRSGARRRADEPWSPSAY